MRARVVATGLRLTVPYRTPDQDRGALREDGRGPRLEYILEVWWGANRGDR
jgi:hypothetical protein